MNLDDALDIISDRNQLRAALAAKDAEIARLRDDRDCEKRLRKDSDDLAAITQEALSAVRAQVRERDALVETWLTEQGLIGEHQTRKPTHGRCCTCQTCGFDYDNCACEVNERTAAWQKFKAETLRAALAGREET